MKGAVRPPLGRVLTPLPLRAARSGRWPSTLVSASVAVAAFTALAYAAHARWLQALDWRASWAVHAYASVWLTALAVMFSTLAEPAMAVAFSVWVAWLAFRRNDTRGAVVAFGTVWIAGALNFLLKQLFRRPRPELWAAQDAHPGFGFPSWHAMAVVAVGGALVLVVGRLHPRMRWPLSGAVALLALGVGASRIYLGLHWTTDVLAGACAGWALLLMVASALDARPFPPTPTR